MSNTVLISGMHRSGTSATAAALMHLGVSLGSQDRMMKPALDKIRGYFESLDIAQFNEAVLHQPGVTVATPQRRRFHNHDLHRLVQPPPTTQPDHERNQLHHTSSVRSQPLSSNTRGPRGRHSINRAVTDRRAAQSSYSCTLTGCLVR